MIGTLAERFWAKVNKTPDCWLWGGATDRDGYGKIGERGESIGAHRVSYELANGPIPAGMCVLHSCDNPPCVNPGHLSIGTQADNMTDRDAKGRGPKGELNPNSVLDWPRVRDIRSRHAAGETCAAIARSMGVGKSNISMIVLNLRWVV